MDKEYKVNNLYSDEKITFSEIITSYLISFLDNDLEVDEI